MTPMVETVARALYVVQNSESAAQRIWDHESFDKGWHLRQARAAIQAMREPTEEMILAAMKGRDGMYPAAVIRSIITSAIDAALSDPSTPGRGEEVDHG